MSEERVGLCPGTFDPITLGHMDIIRRAVKLVDRLVIGVLVNPAKDSLFGLDERVRIVARETGPLGQTADTIIEVLPFEGLLVHFADNVGKGGPVHELHGVEVNASFATHTVDGQDVRVVQLRRGLGFVLEALQLSLIQYGREWQHLERHPGSTDRACRCTSRIRSNRLQAA